MELVSAKNVSLSFSDVPLLSNVNFSIKQKQTIAIVGRNGVGKSSVLKLINKEIQPDEGEIIHASDIVIAKLSQTFEDYLDLTVQSVIALESVECGSVLSRYYQTLHDNKEPDEVLYQQLNESDAWQVDQKINVLLSRFGLSEDTLFSSLSGGQKRRVMLARSLLNEPDLLLLDEPTNHLDIDTIDWMEKMLGGLSISKVIVSHDRRFIDRLATNIMDIDRAKITQWPGNYQQFVNAKEQLLAAQANQEHLQDKHLAQEETWIRQGIKARRTRNEGRVRALKKLRQQRSQRINLMANAKFKLNEGENSGKLVVQADEVSYAYDNQNLTIRKFNTTILRGDKIGIIGPNGCGKSTLIKLLTGNIEPDEGQIRLGTKLNIAYLDQQRQAIREDLSIIDNIAEGQSEVNINGKNIHVMSYIQDFLFSPKRARQNVSVLSGGERNRLLLAKLFTKPFNMLVLDEPTNDLDIETLQLLESLLVDFKGSLLLVSHDRVFLNNIVTSIISFEQGKIKEYIGGYDDWLRQKESVKVKASPKLDAKSDSQNSSKLNDTQKTKKLSYKLQRELEELPQKIEQAEAQIEQLQNQLAQPDFYQNETSLITKTTNDLKDLNDELEKLYQRWQELD